ncbi:MAG: SurA N-terminal domain-containing protein, partial [Alphaproteobacteria bacterium]|nr:SurA N-terminal domain-containing protein [Alphaproteobacteria bacterium]
MLEKLRNQSNSWLFKGLLIIIAASFFIFGIGDMIRGIVSHRPIATVGKGEISMQQLDANLRQQLKQIQAKTNQQISLNDLVKMGLVDKVLDNMVSRLVIEQEMDRLGLVVSENVIRDSIYAMEPFQRDGQFDSEKFNTLLKNAGVNQKVIVDDIRSQTIDRQYFQSFSNVAAMPKFYNDILNSAILSKRSFSILKINSSKMAVDKQPTQDEIKNFFENHKANYTQPESRTIHIAVIDVKKKAEKIAVSDEDLKAAFEEKKHLFFTPETRDLTKIIFKTNEDALAALEELKKGKKLEQLKDIQKPDVKSLKGMTKNLLDPAHQDIVFAAADKAYTPVISTDTEFVVYHVESITPQKQDTFEKVKDQLLHDVRLERYQEDYKALRDKIEDELAGGNDLEKVSKALELSFSSLEKVTASPDNTKQLPAVFTPEQAEQIIAEAFKMEEG